MVITQVSFDTSFVVMPRHCNYLRTMLFGGKLLAEMDIAAAMVCRKALYDTKAKAALTVGVKDVSFLTGATIGDLVWLNAQLIAVGPRSLTVLVTGKRESDTGKVDKLCEGTFTFCAVDKDNNSIKHGLVLI